MQQTQSEATGTIDPAVTRIERRSDEQISQLRTLCDNSWGNRQSSPRYVALCVGATHGLPAAEVAKTFMLPPENVARWFRQYNEGGLESLGKTD